MNVPLTTHDHLASDEYLENYYGKGGHFETNLFERIDESNKKFSDLLNKKPTEIKKFAKEALRSYSNEVIRKSYQPKTETSTTVYEEEINFDTGETDPNTAQFFGDDFNYNYEELRETGVLTTEDILRFIEDKTKLNIKKQPNTEL